MKGPTFVSYVPGYIPDEPMNTFAVAKVLESDHPRYQKGDLVAGVLPIAEYGVIPEMVSFCIWPDWFLGNDQGLLFEKQPMC